MGMKELFLQFLTPEALWMVFGFVCLFAVFVSITLSYHWREYSTDSRRSVRFFRGYMIVLLALLGTMAVNIFLYGS